MRRLINILACARWIALALLWLTAAGAAQAESADNIADTYAPFQSLLDRYLTEQPTPCGGLISWFDYAAALAASDTSDLLREQDAMLAEFDTDTLDTRPAAIAFWANAYNYFMLQHLLTHLDDGQLVSSVRDYGSLFDPYKVFGIERFAIGGQQYSLRAIELDVLLGDAFAERGWKDARVHFAVNCASVGCPALRQVIFEPDTLETMLSENTRQALDTSLHLVRDGNTLRVTSLFDWYHDDFVEQSGSVREFILEYGSDTAAAAVEATNRIRYIDYNWQLNRSEHYMDLNNTPCPP
ncbi:MAG: DUF547 domain-containing protein [Pseudomonadota bacterium]